MLFFFLPHSQGRPGEGDAVGELLVEQMVTGYLRPFPGPAPILDEDGTSVDQPARGTSSDERAALLRRHLCNGRSVRSFLVEVLLRQPVPPW